jgi:hypothetical protein
MKFAKGNSTIWKKHVLCYIVYHKSHMSMPGTDVGHLDEKPVTKRA